VKERNLVVDFIPRVWRLIDGRIQSMFDPSSPPILLTHIYKVHNM
jgi:hypothetical protein